MEILAFLFLLGCLLLMAGAIIGPFLFPIAIVLGAIFLVLKAGFIAIAVIIWAIVAGFKMLSTD